MQNGKLRRFRPRPAGRARVATSSVLREERNRSQQLEQDRAWKTGPAAGRDARTLREGPEGEEGHGGMVRILRPGFGGDGTDTSRSRRRENRGEAPGSLSHAS